MSLLEELLLNNFDFIFSFMTTCLWAYLFTHCKFQITWKKLGVFVLLWLLVLVPAYYFSSINLLNISYIFLHIMFFMWLIGMPWKPKLALCFYVLVLDIFFILTIEMLVKRFFNADYDIGSTNWQSFILRIVIFLLVLIIVFIYSRLIVKKRKHIYISSFVYLYLSIAFFTGMLLLLLVDIYGNNMGRNMHIALLLFAFGIIGVNLMVSIFYIQKQRERDTMQMEVILKEKMLTLQKKYFHDMVTSYHDLRAFRHDVNGYFTLIEHLIADKRYEELAKLTNRLKLQIQENPSSQCSNIYIGAIFNHFYEICQQEKITLQLDYNLLHELQMPADHICSLFYNLIENAVEASCLSEEKIIHLTIHTKDQAFIIEIENSVSTNFSLQHFMQGISTKEISAYHGIGLQNIRSIVSQYNGTMDVEFNENRFVLTIILLSVINHCS